MDTLSQNIKIKTFNNIDDDLIEQSSSKIEQDNNIKSLDKNNRFIPDNYFTYDVERHLSTDFHNIKINNKTNIFTCCFRIIESKDDKIISKPF